jgi:ParB family chromosome partitioning protein
VAQLKPGKFQPRRQFEEEAIADLVESVREKGILQPILVRPYEGSYEIIAGERRWRAAQRAQLHEVPVIIREFTDKEALEVALVENLQRQDLSPLEEADGYRRLVDEFSHTQEELAKAVGKSRSHVANMMRLLALPEPIKAMVEAKQISAGHARALLTAADPLALAREVVDKQLNVRQTEKLAAGEAKAKSASGGGRPAAGGHKDADTAALERDLAELLGVRVTLTPMGKGGELTIHYGSLEQLDDILSRLSGSRN